MRRRSRRRAAASARPSSVPSTSTRPPLGVSSPSISRPIVLLPEPLSPTSPTASPRPTVSETSVTACTARPRPNRPRGGNCLLSPSAATSALMRAPSSAGSASAAPAPPRSAPARRARTPPPHGRSAARRRSPAAVRAATAPCPGSTPAGCHPRFGALASSAAVYGCSGWANTSATLPCSTISPAYITAT